jgi:hypothetical protein
MAKDTRTPGGALARKALRNGVLLSLEFTRVGALPGDFVFVLHLMSSCRPLFLLLNTD